MTNDKKYIDYINQKMALLNESVRLSGQQSLFDINIISENFYRDLLNIIYNDELVNGNFFEQNYKAIDLYSNKSNKCYQVTSRRDKRKIEDTIDKFNELNEKLYEKFDLYFLIIGKKVKNQKIHKEINGNVFDTNKIIDTDDILTKIKNSNIDKKKELYTFFKKYFDNKLIDLNINFFKFKLNDNIENLGERYNSIININTVVNDKLEYFFISNNEAFEYINDFRLFLDNLKSKNKYTAKYEINMKLFKQQIMNNDYTEIIDFINKIIADIKEKSILLQEDLDKENYIVDVLKKAIEKVIILKEDLEKKNYIVDDLKEAKKRIFEILEKIEYGDDIKLLKQQIISDNNNEIIEFINKILAHIKENIILLEKDLEKKRYTIDDLKNAREKTFETLEKFEYANKPLLVLTGKAGMGKTHTLTYFIKKQFIEKEVYGLLLLGQHINERKSIELQIMENLQLNASFDELLFGLNEYGIKNKITIPIIIDGINEGLDSFNWKNYINGLVLKVSRFKFVKLLISIRNEYIELCLPSDLFENNNVKILEHKGFQENFISIMNKIFDCYNLSMPVFPIIDTNFSNPLFTFTFCKTASKLDKQPVIEEYQDFIKVYFDYIQLVSHRLSSKFNYEVSDNILEKIIDNFIVSILEKENNFIYKEDLLEIVEKNTKHYGIIPNDYLVAMKSEGLIYKDILYLKNDNNEYKYVDVIRFSFERYEKILVAKYLLNKYKDIEKIKQDISNNANIGQYFSAKNYYLDMGLIQELFILIQDRFKIEIYEIIDFSNYEEYFQSRLAIAYINSLMWRKNIYDSQKLMKFKEFINSYFESNSDLYYEFLKLLIKVSFIKNHPLNAEFLHNWLITKTLTERDYNWTIAIVELYSYDNDLFDMLFEQCMIQGNKNMNDDTVELLSILLCWLFTSSNRNLRDKATKCLVSILENKISLFNKLINKFEAVNDMYVLERLLASCYGAILRSENSDGLKDFANCLFQTFYKDKVLNPNILVRYYCKSIIEYANNKSTLDFDAKNIYKYKKCSWYKRIPSLSELEKKYMFDYKSEDVKPHQWSQNTIISSMITEYGRGTSGYGDFGRYVFEGLVRKWRHHFNDPQVLSNIVIQNVFAMGYDVELFGYFDRNSKSYDRHSHTIERIGKKYQWISTYELLGKLYDNFSVLKEVYSDTPIDLMNNIYLDYNLKETKSVNKISYVISNDYDLDTAYLKNIDPTLFIINQDKKPIKLLEDANEENWIDIEIDIEKFIVKNINGVEYISLGNLEDWVNDEHIIDYNHPGKKRVAIKSVMFFVDNNKQYLKPDSERLCDKDWHTYYNTYILEYNNSDYYFNNIVRDEYDGEDKLQYTFISYCWESANYDCSIEGSINIAIPSDIVIKGLKLHQGKDYKWYNNKNELICFDTSLDNGNMNLLINRKEFMEFVKEKNISLVWGIYYEKTTSDEAKEWRINAVLKNNGKFDYIILETEKWNLHNF